MKISGAVALVTGGAMGLGKAITEELLEKGAKCVCILDFNSDAGTATEEEFSNKFGADRINFFQCDVSSKEQLQEAFQKSLDIHKRLDIVCNNAGVDDLVNVEKVISINLVGTMNGTILARDIMMKQTNPQGGLIINMSSLAGLYPSFYSPLYCASKYGVVGFTRAIAMNPLVMKANVRLNMICPSFVDTGMVARSKVRAEQDPLLKMVLSKANIQPISKVVEAFVMAVEDDKLHGEALRVTPGLGIDLHPFESEENLKTFELFKM